MASDTRGVMDALGITKAAFIGWSDGADTALVRRRAIFTGRRWSCSHLSIEPSAGRRWQLLKLVRRILGRRYVAIRRGNAQIASEEIQVGVERRIEATFPQIVIFPVHRCAAEMAWKILARRTAEQAGVEKAFEA